jgi:hypothetical protein
MDVMDDPLLLAEDGVVHEPPTIAEPADPSGEPFAPAPVARRPSPLLALPIGAVFAGAVMALALSRSWAFGLPTEDAHGWILADVAWDESAAFPLARARVVVRGNMEQLEWEFESSRSP